ncbi:MAG: MarR family transcriptional regulator [Paludibacteraceae bacterium]|nr:MarR family transcriptional regulator [Paludibacteraceae bacterium]
MGYFITYHLRALDLAFKKLQSYIQKKILNKQKNSDILRIGGLNERQGEIISWLRDNPNIILTVKEIETRFAISHPTAKLDMDGFVARGFITKVPVNKVKYNYFRADNFDELIGKKN